jgi:uncharacterized protein YbaR (Trm112 family)
MKEDKHFGFAEIVTLACPDKHAWYSLISEGLPFFLDMKEYMNTF